MLSVRWSAPPPSSAAHRMVAGIGVVVAVKGLARDREFTNAQQREQFIIGTLVSLLWAAPFAGAARRTTPPGPFPRVGNGPGQGSARRRARRVRPVHELGG
ncbi:hypothetical protein QJS66_02715 [Kocuria rhizophila]|nr:hypothetical protein QJS66_02715 [Kocuria rhizophila]